MANMDVVDSFLAIDVETATAQGHLCQIGIAGYENGELLFKGGILIQPPANKYDCMNILVHGISPEDTAEAPTLDRIWSRLYEMMDGNYIVGHNLSFDMSQIRKDAEYYGLPMFHPKAEICTCDLHGRASLYDVAKYYGLSLDNHHDALCDAICCAEILLKYYETGIEYPVIPRSKETEPSFREAREIKSETKKKDLEHCIDKDTVFYDKRVVITGILERFPMREELAEILKSLGADVNTSISRKTDIVIAGKGAGPKKLEKIKTLNDEGAHIELMCECKLNEILDKCAALQHK